MDDPYPRRKTCKRHDEPGHAHELTFSCFKRRPFLSRPRPCEYLAEAIAKAKAKHHFHVWAYVFMPEHVHLLIWPLEPVYSISAVLKSIKQSVARRAIRYLRLHNPRGLRRLATGQKNQPHAFWQDGGGYDRNVTMLETVPKMVEYIHANPVRRGLVRDPEDWFWSSARALGHWQRRACAHRPGFVPHTVGHPQSKFEGGTQCTPTS